MEKTNIQECIPVVPSFSGEVHLRWRGVVTQSPPMPQRLTLFSSEQATEASSLPLSGGLEGDDRNLYIELGHTSTTKLEAPKNAMEAKIPQGQVHQIRSTPRVSKETLGTSSP
jgi:hypothetical protein